MQTAEYLTPIYETNRPTTKVSPWNSRWYKITPGFDVCCGYFELNLLVVLIIDQPNRLYYAHVKVASVG